MNKCKHSFYLQSNLSRKFLILILALQIIWEKIYIRNRVTKIHDSILAVQEGKFLILTKYKCLCAQNFYLNLVNKCLIKFIIKINILALPISNQNAPFKDTGLKNKITSGNLMENCPKSIRIVIQLSKMFSLSMWKQICNLNVNKYASGPECVHTHHIVKRRIPGLYYLMIQHFILMCSTYTNTLEITQFFFPHFTLN